MRKKLQKERVYGIEKFRHTSRITPRVREAAKKFTGTPNEKVHQVALFVIRQIPLEKVAESERKVVKKTVFNRNAEKSLRKIEPASELHCAARSNLTIALLNAMGQKAWLVREINFSKGFNNASFHDYVETLIDGKLHSLVFGKNSFFFLPGTPKLVKRAGVENALYLRGADTRQIGGVKNWEDYEKFIKKFRRHMPNEIKKNQQRMDLMVREEIMPTEARMQIFGLGG